MTESYYCLWRRCDPTQDYGERERGRRNSSLTVYTKFWQGSLLSTFRNLFESPNFFLAALPLKPHLHYTVSSEQTYRQEQEQEEEKERLKKKKKRKKEKRKKREERGGEREGGKKKKKRTQSLFWLAVIIAWSVENRALFTVTRDSHPLLNCQSSTRPATDFVHNGGPDRLHGGFVSLSNHPGSSVGQ